MIGFRRVCESDRYQISNLIQNDSNAHRHRDWRSPLEWLGASYYWALEEHGKLIAALACPEDPPQVGWIRLFACQPHYPVRALWAQLWEAARAEINPQTFIAAIAAQPEFQNLLLDSGFEISFNVVALERQPLALPPFSAPQDFRIRPMRAEDLPVVAQLDLEAFGTFWHTAADSLNRGRLAAEHATVAENDAGIIGYQISNNSSEAFIHLARLAVKPQAQGIGVGSALINELLQYGAMRRFSVNTQRENAASLALYKKAGFVLTGEVMPVLVYRSRIEPSTI